MKVLLLIVTYICSLLMLVVYSYTQVDLNLTLSSNTTYLYIQKILTHVGYFDRPLSTILFTGILGLLFLHYVGFLYLASKKKLSQKNIIIIITLSVGILFFTYPGFSHDVFNYIFDARIIAKYGLNPYQYKALDFPDDTWIRFMHWTHRTYPYGPLWVLITLPFYFMGLGKFVLTLVSFKILFTLSYIGSIILLYKTLLKKKKEHAQYAIIWFGLNPLVLIESLVSPHNEIVVLFFVLLSLYFVNNKRIGKSIISMIVSGAIKFLSWIYIPFLLLIRKKPESFEMYIKWMIIATMVVLTPVIYTRELYPWYLLPIVGLGSLLTKSPILKSMVIGITVGALLRYIPYLYMGDYSDWVKQVQLYLTMIPLVLIPLLTFLFNRKPR